ncbi:aminotransferase class I/II-fold pyridoxal phosphate-dependent enzyme, partial [Enterococcus sp. S181_ASV_20]|nr:aminotransferase class I/II-fold pyridoxal phosphate-dependent enzyme [Enterococcus sp. S181_ASV_20]
DVYKRQIKAVFVVNPSNPTANALAQPTIDLLKEIVATDNPELMILTDDVYGTFVHVFSSLFSEIPYNTDCIYS